MLRRNSVQKDTTVSLCGESRENFLLYFLASPVILPTLLN